MFEPKVVIAIDFGTAKSGYAFSFNDPKDIKANIFAYKDTREKVFTALLLKGDPKELKFVAFGNEAIFKLSVPDNSESPEMHGFRNYKMNLHEMDSFLESFTPSKARIPIIDILACTIGFLADSALEQINQMTTNKLKIIRENAQWVITVPAIWNSAMKQTMRKAAEQAGLPSNLILALEPEAAALCCRYNRRDLNFIPGTKYMLVDCGGGTIDIVFHEIDSQGNTLELCGPTGGAWGSTKVNQKFHEMMLEIFGEEQLVKEKLSYSDMQLAFEDEKIKFSPDQECPVYIFVATLMPTYLQKYNDNKEINSKISFSHLRLAIPSIVMASLFEEPIAETIACVEKSIASLKIELDYIFLVGGFSKNSILQGRMKKFNNTKTKVVIPDRSNMAVVEGAVHFGLYPNIILSRFSAFSYGIEGMVAWNDSFPEKYKLEVDGKLFCDRVFRALVKVNERVQQDHEVCEMLGPTKLGQPEAYIPIFATKDPNLRYIPADMKEIGHLTLTLPPNELPETENIKVTMHFGGTEIKVKAEHIVTKKAISCEIDFSYISGLPDVVPC